MNLMEESFQNKEEKNKKTISRIILVLIILLLIAIISITAYLMYVKNNTLKLYLDGQSNEKLKELLVIEEDGTVYAPIKDIASYLGYDSYSGEYSDKSEDRSKCYVQSKEGKEVANFTLNSNKVYKLDLTTNSTDNYEYIYADKPVKANNGVLYADSEMIEEAFNVSFEYSKDENRITILTMPYLIQFYSNKVLDHGYTEISDVLANQKTVLKDMLVVKKDGKYAVIDVQGNAILEAKYDNITYLPNVGDFLVESNKKVGIMSKNKDTKIQIIYDSIELMDADAQLYVAKKDNKYGVIDFKGNIKIYIENDGIGMDISKFEKNNIKNKYILAGNLIPAKRDNLWGLYDKNGNLVVDFYYDSFGYVASSNKNALNLLVIPDYNVLVACKNKKYTLLSSTGQELFAAPVADDIYMTIVENTKYYYITANNGTMDATVYLDKIGVSSEQQKNNNEITSTNTPSQNNSTTNNTTQNNNENQEHGVRVDANEQQNDDGEQEESNQQQDEEQENQE